MTSDKLGIPTRPAARRAPAVGAARVGAVGRRVDLDGLVRDGEVEVGLHADEQVVATVLVAEPINLRVAEPLRRGAQEGAKFRLQYLSRKLIQKKVPLLAQFGKNVNALPAYPTIRNKC